jgi:uncharacterized delta-60 repeat protein
MRKRIFNFLNLMCCISICGSGSLLAAGGVDSSFNSALSGTTPSVYASAIQPDGKIVIGGLFTTVGGSTRNNVARVSMTGAVDSFNPNVNSTIRSVAVQADGKVILGGAFSTVAGVARLGIARVDSAGVLDAAYNPVLDASVLSMAVQTDGKLIIVGGFTHVGGAVRNYVARLNTDGTLDSNFNPNASSPVFSVAIQTDGRILLGGNFTTMGSTSVTAITRVNAVDGSVDAGFTNPTVGPAGTYVNAIVIQGDGRILIGGTFTLVGGASHTGIMRLNANGSPDTYTTNLAGGIASPTAFSLTTQTDGKVIVGGTFGSAGGLSRNGLARISDDGTVDSAFVLSGAASQGIILNTIVQSDGKILAGGPLLAGTSVTYFTRLNNDAATQTLNITNSNTVQWMRGGTSPETQQASLDVSTDAGANWTTVGTGTRISGGWQFTGLSLTGSGQVRARARVTGGNYSGSSGLVEQVQSFTVVPTTYTISTSAIPIAGGILSGGGTFNSGATVAVVATTNPGYKFTNWTEGGSVVSAVASYTFTASANRILVANFSTLTPQEIWRQLYFGTTNNSGNAANLFDYDHDGLVNLIEYAFGLNPTLGSSVQLPQGQKVGSNFVLSFVQPAGVTGITYGAQWSPTMANGSWTSITDTGSGGTHVFSVPVVNNLKVFVRVTVTGS